MARLLLLPDPTRAHQPGSVDRGEDHARIFGGGSRTGTTVSMNCAIIVAYQSSMQWPRPVRRRDSGGYRDTRRLNKLCATTTATRSVSREPALGRDPRDDLAGHVLAQEDWEVVCFPAIAEDDETWVLDSEFGLELFIRRCSEALHPERQPRATLDHIRRTIGE